MFTFSFSSTLEVYVCICALKEIYRAVKWGKSFRLLNCINLKMSQNIVWAWILSTAEHPYHWEGSLSIRNGNWKGNEKKKRHTKIKTMYLMMNGIRYRNKYELFPFVQPDSSFLRFSSIWWVFSFVSFWFCVCAI